MLASKPILPSPTLHLPTVSKNNRRRFRSSPTFSSTSMASTNPSENVSALKAKYTDYAMWLKASSRQNREPVFTHELLKHSLCQMGIDSAQADQLVSTCSWYVYQFQKELGVGSTEQPDQSITTEAKKSPQSSKKRQKKTRTIKSKKIIMPRDHSGDSVTTITSINKENSVSPGLSSPTRNKYFVLPAIQPSDSSSSPRSRHVDFDNEEQLIGKQKPSHWRTVKIKTRILPKLRPSEIESTVTNHDDITRPENTPTDFDLSSSQRPPSITSRQTRSILRKQISTCSSVASTERSSRKNRSRILTPASTVIDEVPLGTKSQRLFGGSECFAQILNELEEQKLS